MARKIRGRKKKPLNDYREKVKTGWIWHMDGLMRIMAEGEFTELYQDVGNDCKPVLKLHLEAIMNIAVLADIHSNHVALEEMNVPK